MSVVHILDYDVGNLLSVQRAFEARGASVTLCTTPEETQGADRLVLPGVGAFGDGMKELQARGFDKALRDYVARGRPLLGICLGMQMLLESSSEFGEHPGLGIIPGKVLPIPDAGNNGELHKIPHIGWNKIYSKGEDRNPAWKRSVLTGTPSNASVYFVHSYMVVPDRPENNLAICDYDGISICAAVKKDNVYGTQFHPEKSGEIGLEVINQFLHL